uniref:glutaminase n=1 Tax=Amphiprion ocellaris TaxID=80972 RepID=A0AAQ5ZRH8_AMPOC
MAFLVSRVYPSLHQENAFKAPQLWSGKHAFLHHHRGKRASAHLTLYRSKHRFVYIYIHLYMHLCRCLHYLDRYSFSLCLFSALTLRLTQIPCLQALKKTGLHPSDPRLRDCMENLRHAMKESVSEVMMDRDLFHRCVGGNIVLLIQAFRKKFIIPEFDVFAQKINEIYKTVQKQRDGKVADYIPQLAKFSPELWGVSLCTVDGQRHSVGDTKQPFCLQSCVKPLQYAIAVHEAGTEKVHRYVGMEPSGLKFNVLSLDDEGTRPHNPMVNAGAIVISSLIKVNRRARFFVKKMAGQEYVGFSNATFQSEKETGDRNFAIGYYMKEKKCFPPGADMIDALDFYFQLCSTEVTCESGSIMAATLANGGICPITGERVLSAEAVRDTLSLMHSCGMYDFSGQMAFHVSNIRKFYISLPMFSLKNRSAMSLLQELVSLFNFHNYDNLRHFVKKQDPRRQDGEDRNKSVFNLMFAAYSGDVSALRRFALSSMDMDLKDYDCRTALHVAAAEGHIEVVKFLTETCKVDPFVEDRWGNLPVDDAMQFGHDEVVKMLKDYQQDCRQQEKQHSEAERPQKLDTIESMV